jgi:hypothetical protein
MACTHPPAFLYDVNLRTQVCAFCVLEELKKQLDTVRCHLESTDGPSSFLWVADLARHRMEELAGLRQENLRLKKSIGAALEQLAQV